MLILYFCRKFRADIIITKTESWAGRPFRSSNILPTDSGRILLTVKMQSTTKVITVMPYSANIRSRNGKMSICRVSVALVVVCYTVLSALLEKIVDYTWSVFISTWLALSASDRWMYCVAIYMTMLALTSHWYSPEILTTGVVAWVGIWKVRYC